MRVRVRGGGAGKRDGGGRQAVGGCEDRVRRSRPRDFHTHAANIDQEHAWHPPCSPPGECVHFARGAEHHTPSTAPLMMCIPRVSRLTVRLARTLSAVSLNVAALVLAACNDTLTQPKASVAGPMVQQAVPVTPGEDGDLPTVPRFTVAVVAEGSLRTGAPISLRATVRANLATRVAEVRLVMPEVAIAQANGWRVASAPVNVTVPTRAQRTVSLAAGEELALTDEVVIPVPGYYRVVLSAVQRSDEPVVDEGRWVPNAAHKEVWLLVDDRGGRVTPTFDPALLPDGVLPQPGPARPGRTRPPALPPVQAASRDPLAITTRAAPITGQTMDAQSPGSRLGSVRRMNGSGLRQLVYHNPDINAWQPVPGVTVRWDVYDNQFGSVTGNGSAITDAGGYYTAPCLASYESAYGTWTMQNSYSTVEYTGYWGESGCDLTDQQYSLSSPHSWLYLYITQFAPWSHGLLSQSRGPVALWYDPNLSGAKYAPGNDRITVGVSPYIYGQFGRFTLAHEYGHALHEKALDGNAAGGQCPTTHYLNGYYNLECAFSEGFADFMGAASQNVWDVGIYYQYIVDYTNGPWFGAGQDGSIQEAAVAALLYDMADTPGGDGGASEPWDGVGGAYQVALTIKHCRLYTSGGFTTRPRGADHFVYCAERNIDPAVRSSFFTTRTTTYRPTSITANAGYSGDWPTPAVRPVWRKNLYGLN